MTDKSIHGTKLQTLFNRKNEKATGFERIIGEVYKIVAYKKHTGNLAKCRFKFLMVFFYEMNFQKNGMNIWLFLFTKKVIRATQTIKETYI